MVWRRRTLLVVFLLIKASWSMPVFAKGKDHAVTDGAKTDGATTDGATTDVTEHQGKKSERSTENDSNNGRSPQHLRDKVSHVNKIHENAEGNSKTGPKSQVQYDDTGTVKQSASLLSKVGNKTLAPSLQRSRSSNDENVMSPEKLEIFVGDYKISTETTSDGRNIRKHVIKLLASLVVQFELTEEELAMLICAILCGLGTCPPGCPGYYEPPWGPSDI